VTTAASNNNTVHENFNPPTHHLSFVVWIIKQLFVLVQYFSENSHFL
jgi:hypothetical protein